MLLWIPEHVEKTTILNLLKTLESNCFQQKAQDLIHSRYPSFNHKKIYVDAEWNEIDTTCAICLEPADNQLRCSHIFHKRCLSKWKGTCPLCRRDIAFF